MDFNLLPFFDSNEALPKLRIMLCNFGNFRANPRRPSGGQGAQTPRRRTGLTGMESKIIDIRK